jgi:hypothetical protein
VQADAQVRDELSISTKGMLLVLTHDMVYRQRKLKEKMVGYTLAMLQRLLPSRWKRGEDLVALADSFCTACDRREGVQWCRELQLAMRSFKDKDFLGPDLLSGVLQALAKQAFACKACARVLKELLVAMAAGCDAQVRSQEIGVVAKRTRNRLRLRRLGESVRRSLLLTYVKQHQTSSTREIGRLIHKVSDSNMALQRQRLAVEYLTMLRRLGADLQGPLSVCHDSTRLGNPAREFDTFVVTYPDGKKSFLPMQALGGNRAKGVVQTLQGGGGTGQP